MEAQKLFDQLVAVVRAEVLANVSQAIGGMTTTKRKVAGAKRGRPKGSRNKPAKNGHVKLAAKLAKKVDGRKKRHSAKSAEKKVEKTAEVKA